MIKQYDKIKLKTGEIATITEVFSNPDSYVADIEKATGTETEFIYPEQIQTKID